MPKPNCTEQGELDLGVIDFGRLGRREVQGCFDGGSMTSDGGVMLLAAADRKIGLTAAASRCIADPRNPLLITHAVRDMLRQRVMPPPPTHPPPPKAPRCACATTRATTASSLATTT